MLYNCHCVKINVFSGMTYIVTLLVLFLYLCVNSDVKGVGVKLQGNTTNTSHLFFSESFLLIYNELSLMINRESGTATKGTLKPKLTTYNRCSEILKSRLCANTARYIAVCDSMYG